MLAGVVQRLLSKRWSPEQVAHELRVLFADQPSRWLCKETIYQAIYDAAVALTRPVRRAGADGGCWGCSGVDG